eukprot:m.187604 g.187604  ORF g.187604 m.187604 type:complete len:88 (+) comp53579_c0_seq5:783-1046(+)
MIKYRATGFMAGHDHCLEYLDDNSGLVYVLSGAGAHCCYSNTNMAEVPAKSLKFLVAEPSDTFFAGFVGFQVTFSHHLICTPRLLVP